MSFVSVDVEFSPISKVGPSDTLCVVRTSRAVGFRSQDSKTSDSMENAWFDLHHTVTADEVDAQKHVHNLRYLQWTLWAARDHNASVGWDAQSALEAGFGWVVRDHSITYRVAAVANDAIIVRTWISQISRYASVRKSLICRPTDRRILCRVSTRWVYIDLREHRALDVPDFAAARYRILDHNPPPPWVST